MIGWQGDMNISVARIQFHSNLFGDHNTIGLVARALDRLLQKRFICFGIGSFSQDPDGTLVTILFQPKEEYTRIMYTRAIKSSFSRWSNTLLLESTPYRYIDEAEETVRYILGFRDSVDNAVLSLKCMNDFDDWRIRHLYIYGMDRSSILWLCNLIRVYQEWITPSLGKPWNEYSTLAWFDAVDRLLPR